ncbi:BglG family transcription antiterminator [Paratractidigestivibacter sp.]|uniref:BglG family transcription antiterminator n=1 Tax=Paratractidigestivibacter sp. TaxID=2847316 RepID=UPI002AC91557|nr:PTS sugar transporter subunit IIA [Paratractidigestivibacter sp.]
MNKRSLAIVRSLCEGDELTLDSLAGAHGVSTRTIRKDLDAIDGALRARGLAGIMLERGGRVVCVDSPLPLLESNEGEKPGSFHLEQEARILLAAALVAGAMQPITLGDIAEKLMVSRGTVINDLDEIKQVLANHRLETVSQSGRGLHAEGREYDRRRIALHAFRAATPSERRFIERELDLLHPDSDAIEKIFLEQQYAHDQVLTDVCEADTLAFVRISLARMAKGRLISSEEGPRPPATSRYVPLASDLVDLFAQYLHVETTAAEKDALCYRLRHQQFAHRGGENVDAARIQLLTRRFITQLSRELGIDLTDDFTFFESLSAHLGSVLQPVPVDYPGTDAVEEVMAANPAITAATRTCDAQIREQAGRDLTDIELGFIVLHVCAAIERKKSRQAPLRVVVACNSGVGTSQLLTVRLQARFNITVVRTCTVREAMSVDTNDADLIVTTVPLKGSPVTSVVVSPMLSDAEALRVGEKLAELRAKRGAAAPAKQVKPTAQELISRIGATVYDLAPDQAPPLMRSINHLVTEYFAEFEEGHDVPAALAAFELLPPSHIRLDVECADWRDAVRRSADVLLKGGYIEERYIDAIVRNIEENGPYVVLTPGFAMPHEGTDAGPLMCGLSMIRLAHPVEFGEPDLDPVEFVCCLSAVDHSSHLRALFNLVNLMRREEVRAELHAAATPEEFAGIIERLELDIKEG